MIRNAVLGFIIFVLFVGCGAARKKVAQTQVEEMQGHISSLESELERKDEKIKSLEGELESTGSKQTNVFEKGVMKAVKSKESAGKFTLKQVQTALKNAGYYKGTVDGKTGKNTKKAIKAFQKDNGLKADGVVGKKTWLKLKKHL